MTAPAQLAAHDLIERLNANPPKARIKVDPTKPFVEAP